MTEPTVLQKDLRLPPSQDYEFLRLRGLEYIRGLSGAAWTDHNEHDPGVTLLQVLCYALVDLGYRTGFDLRDLLTDPNGALDPPELSSLFPPGEVLPVAPLTIHDYRRLLLKIEGVRNAWLDPQNEDPQAEVPLYADPLTGELTYQSVNSAAMANLPLKVRGLYRVMLELEIDDLLGSLNETRLVFQARRGPLKGLVFELDSTLAFQSGGSDFGLEFLDPIEVSLPVKSGSTYQTEAKIFAHDPVNNQDLTVLLPGLILRVINDRPRPGANPLVVAPADLQALLGDGAADGPLLLFWIKQQRRKVSLAAARCALMANRNLCEDIFRVETVQANSLAVCADIELLNEVDIEQVQAQVFHAIELYLNPPVHFYTLQELLAEGQTLDEIFNAPTVDPAFTCGAAQVPIFSKPGFVKTRDLEQSELRREVFVSDIINLLMDIPGVVAVRNVLLRKIGADGSSLGVAQKWSMPITPNRQPVLAIEQSKILFYKNQVPFRARRTEFQRTLEGLRAQARKAAYGSVGEAPEIAPGRYRQPETFYSIQHDLPRTYLVGEAGLPAAAPASRVAQARQLKAYLTFYDQVLANFLAQLGGLRRFFSLDKNLSQSYFSQYLDEIAGTTSAVDFADEFYVDKTRLQDESYRNRLVEDENTFLNRRNRTLDHLMARFAEQFTDYVLMMYNLEGDTLRTQRELIDDKIDFLRAAPVVSRERAEAFNYRPGDLTQVWNTPNVSGLEKRLSRLVGISDSKSLAAMRRDLACPDLFIKYFRTQKEVNLDQHRVVIKKASGEQLFKSDELFPDQQTALDQAALIFPFVRRESSYQVDASGGPDQVFFTISAGGASLRSKELFETEADAMQRIRVLIDRFDQILQEDPDCDQEGFHLVEHILLRPLSGQEALLQTCLDPAIPGGVDDPYSFRLQAILPYWPRRFQNMDFRRFFEASLRLETPAHLHVRVCWVSYEQMALFEAAYRRWLEATASDPGGSSPSPARLQAQKDLLEILQQLRTVYPAATLHDCFEDEDENVVRLDSTNLGIF